jgi:hypothetical protein
VRDRRRLTLRQAVTHDPRLSPRRWRCSRRGCAARRRIAAYANAIDGNINHVAAGPESVRKAVIGTFDTGVGDEAAAVAGL